MPSSLALLGVIVLKADNLNWFWVKTSPTTQHLATIHYFKIEFRSCQFLDHLFLGLRLNISQIAMNLSAHSLPRSFRIWGNTAVYTAGRLDWPSFCPGSAERCRWRRKGACRTVLKTPLSPCPRWGEILRKRGKRGWWNTKKSEKVIYKSFHPTHNLVSSLLAEVSGGGDFWRRVFLCPFIIYDLIRYGGRRFSQHCYSTHYWSVVIGKNRFLIPF